MNPDLLLFKKIGPLESIFIATIKIIHIGRRTVIPIPDKIKSTSLLKNAYT